MENLKQNINKTDTLKNDLKLAKQKINDKILSGGGTIANTISDIPSAIDKMLKENYKKIAIWEGSERFKPPYNQISAWTKKINCDFKISRFIIFFKGAENKGVRIGLDSKDYTTFKNPGDAGTTVSQLTKLSVSNNVIKFEIDNSRAYVLDYLITKIIAIE